MPQIVDETQVPANGSRAGDDRVATPAKKRIEMSEMTDSDRVAEQTRIRRALLANGYSPFPCRGKSGQLKGWQHIRATEALIDEWAGQLRWVSTAVHAGVGGLVGIDVDIDDACVLDDFIARIPEGLWVRLQDAPVRRGGGVKEMWLVRLADGEEPRRFRETTGKWGDPESGEDDTDHKLEVWPKAHKLLALYGARTVEGRDVTSEYAWVDGRGPDTVALRDLPVVTNADIGVLLDCAVAAMKAAGWDRLDVADVEGSDSDKVFDLKDDMTFRTRDHGEVGLAELIELCQAVGDVRLYSWLPGKRRRADRCHAKLNDHDGLLQIYDYDTGKLHRAAEADGAYTRKIVEGVRSAVAGIQSRGTKAAGSTRAEKPSGAGDYAEDDAEMGLDSDAEPERDEPGVSRLEALAAKVPAERRVFAEPNPSDKAQVQIEEGDLHEIANQTVALLRDLHTALFDMGGMPVVVDEDIKIRPARGDRMAHEMQRVLRFVQVRETKKGVIVKSIEPPKPLVGRVEVLSHHLPPLRGLVDMPVVRRDGALLAEGYDENTQLLVVGGAEVAADVSAKVATGVSAQDAAAALDTLWAPFAQFPFAGPLDRGGALAAVLTAVLRPILPTAPMFVFDAPAQGSGKTLMSLAVGELLGGAQLMAPLPSKDEQEVRKTILSILLDAPRAVVFDNQWGLLDSAALAGMLTSPTFSGRLLGTNTTLKAPTGILVMLTGNNVALGGEMPRRTVRVRIDAGMETPFTRNFDFCPQARVRRDRGKLVAAALSLILWALPQAANGRIGSFEMWDEMIGQTVARIGKDLDARFGDPVDAIKAAHADDPRRDELSEMLNALRDEFGNKWFTGADVVARLAGSGSGGTNPLLDALGVDKAPSSKTVGRLLTFRRDAVMDGMRIQIGRDSKTKVNRFRVWSDADAEGVVVEGEIEKRRTEQKAKLTAIRPA